MAPSDIRIGVDFDNTVVSYDSVFHRVATEGGLIPESVPISKISVRDYLRRDGREQTWIEMQGYVYGARMCDAEFYPGVLDFFRWARATGVSLFIISHKTKYPFAGLKYDLHEASISWVDERLRDGGKPLVKTDAVYFELTKEDKFARIASLQCTVFLDDLPEVLLSDSFPRQTEPLLFDPDGHHPNTRLQRIASWHQLREVIEPRSCCRKPS